jgi:dihydroorotase
VIDLAISGGRVIDPARGVDAPATVAVDAGRLVAADAGVQATRTIDATGLLVVPGLVDLHVHVYPGVSHYGVEADQHCLLRGVTTAVDTGSAGAATFPGFRRWVIERARTRVLAFLHIAVQGMISSLVGELEEPRWASPALSVVCANENPDVIVGIKVRLGHQMVGQDPERAFVAARKAADRLELPLMVHVIDLPRPLSWLLPRLGEGDVVTHCFHGSEGGSLLGDDGRVIPEARDARERGVLFDVGHGVGSFTFRVAREALEQGFPPDTISSDIHVYNVDGPVFDQPTTLSKLLHLGMDLPAVIEATTAAPALAVRRGDTIGSLAAGREADVTVLALEEGEHDLIDAAEEHQRASARLVPRWVVRGGDVFDLTAGYAAPSNSSA